MGKFVDTCAIWGKPAELLPNPGGRNGEYYNSPRAGGKYFIVRSAKPQLSKEAFTVEDKLKLTTWLVDTRIAGSDCPEIDTNVTRYVKSYSIQTVQSRIIKLLGLIESSITTIGITIDIKSDDNDPNYMAALAWSESRNGEEIYYLLKTLKSQRMINCEFTAGAVTDIEITPHGYQALEETRRNLKKSEQAFVAMWFDESLNETYDNSVAPAIRETGYKPIRVDREEHLDKIDDKIIAELKRSRFIVADFTHGNQGVRGGVYYEAGFAHGLNIPVIFTCREDCFNDVHFDTNHYNHITWNTPEDLKDKLKNRILAVIGEGPLIESVKP